MYTSNSYLRTSNCAANSPRGWILGRAGTKVGRGKWEEEGRVREEFWAVVIFLLRKSPVVYIQTVYSCTERHCDTVIL